MNPLLAVVVVTLTLYGCSGGGSGAASGGGGGGGGGESAPLSGGAVKGPLIDAKVTAFSFDATAADLKGSMVGGGITNKHAAMAGVALPLPLDPPYILEFTTTPDTRDLTTGQLPVIPTLRTIATREKLNTGQQIYATPLTTVATDLAVALATVDGSTSETEFLSAVDTAAQQVTSTLGFGMGADVNIFDTPPLVTDDTDTNAELSAVAAYRTAVEALTALVEAIAQNRGASPEAVLVELTADLADGAIDGSAGPLVDPTILTQDPTGLTIPNTSITVGDVESVLVSETATTGAIAGTTSLSDGTVAIDPASAETDPDSDGDGHYNAYDFCPNTPSGDVVDSDGCSASQLDNDGDGVSNALDLCPATPDGEPVNADGCSASQRDSDGDGVSDALDLCPATPDGEPVNADGCSASQLDSDGDGVSDAQDLCPATPDGEPVNVDGCATSQLDSDGDGVSDALDLCSDTPVDEPANADGCSASQLDSDGDGVSDAQDLCPATPDGEPVNADGCAASQLDSDGDGVSDALDVCPGTPDGEPVNADGCSPSQLDSDGDGVSDTFDLCPATPDGEPVNADGCAASQLDSDGDGVSDALDVCPGTPDGEPVNADGCATSQLDSDGDGVSDALDLCPATPDGDPVNADGCAASQLDSDGDGVSDALDLCPATPDGEPVDADGCSASQLDSDGDGVSDAFDLCPGTPDGEPVNADGCAVSQADSDGDGVSDTLDLCPATPDGEPVNADGCSPSQLAGNLSAGEAHTCALTAAGGVKCWGNNYSGQLGDGTTTDSSIPVDVTGLTSGVVAIASGSGHTCALTTAGGVKCWGWNIDGQLGNGTTIDSSVPVEVTGLADGVAAITAGDFHTCALNTAGGVQCWGYNEYGQLGEGTVTYSTVPVNVTGLNSGVAAIAAGRIHTCALTTTGGVKCWGWGAQLGNGRTTGSYIDPVDVTGLGSGVIAITASFGHTCALTTTGGVQCWGYNVAGQLGDGTTTDSTIPVEVTGLAGDVVGVAAGYGHTCALTAAGAAQCWGWNEFGQLGDGTVTSSTVPVDVTGLAEGVVAVVAGGHSYGGHTCALTTSGKVTCWGQNQYGQLGDGTTTDSAVPVDVTGFPSLVDNVAAGSHHTCAVTTAGGVKCWGHNAYGQLGDDTTTGSALPVAVTGLTNGVAAIAGGTYHTCALTTAGGVQCWGLNDDGQLGDGTTTGSAVPVDVTGLTSGVAAIAAGDYYTCAVTMAGGVKCWGHNVYGQLGDGTTTGSAVPVDVTGLTSGVAAVAAGFDHTCALTVAGGMKCWGNNLYGQLGDGTKTSSAVPVDVTGLTSGVAAIAAGLRYTCAVTTAGGAKCWGNNVYGQLGDDTTTVSTIPVDVTGLGSGVTSVSAGFGHTCAVTTTGDVKCWGLNLNGQLGNGTTTRSSIPVNVTGLGSGMAVAAGNAHTCALTADKTVKCWGYNLSGQLGDGTTTDSSVPVDVSSAL